jgi:vacuolar-type H+-ATPase subunit H
MQTLLRKVQTVEAEASRLVHEAKQASQQTLSQIRAGETKLMADIRAKAERKAAAIVDEHVRQAAQEINAIRQEQKQSEETAHRIADKNRQDTLMYARKIFNEEYLQP